MSCNKSKAAKGNSYQPKKQPAGRAKKPTSHNTAYQTFGAPSVRTAFGRKK